jgi:hypothetical protein
MISWLFVPSNGRRVRRNQRNHPLRAASAQPGGKSDKLSLLVNTGLRAIAMSRSALGTENGRCSCIIRFETAVRQRVLGF